MVALKSMMSRLVSELSERSLHHMKTRAAKVVAVFAGNVRHFLLVFLSPQKVAPVEKNLKTLTVMQAIFLSSKSFHGSLTDRAIVWICRGV